MVPPKYDRHVYGVTPPRELDEDESDDSHSPELRGEKDHNSKSSPTTSKLDTGNVSDVCRKKSTRVKTSILNSFYLIYHIGCYFIKSSITICSTENSNWFVYRKLATD